MYREQFKKRMIDKYGRVHLLNDPEQQRKMLQNRKISGYVEFKDGKVPADIPSATQWTSVTDLTNNIIYYRTMYNSAIRSIDLKRIDFSRTKYKAVPMDEIRQQPIIAIKIK